MMTHPLTSTDHALERAIRRARRRQRYQRHA